MTLKAHSLVCIHINQQTHESRHFPGPESFTGIDIATRLIMNIKSKSSRPQVNGTQGLADDETDRAGGSAFRFKRRNDWCTWQFKKAFPLRFAVTAHCCTHLEESHERQYQRQCWKKCIPPWPFALQKTPFSHAGTHKCTNASYFLSTAPCNLSCNLTSTPLGRTAILGACCCFV